MLRKYFPWGRAKSVFAIDYPALLEKGYRAVIFDIDNTLVHHGADSTPEVDQLFRDLQAMGLKTCLLSNNGRPRVERFLQNIDAPYLWEAGKPDPDCFRRAAALVEVPVEQAVMVGDQIFFDILGANRCGMASILVDFIRLPGVTKIGKKRYLEKLILFFYGLDRRCRNRL